MAVEASNDRTADVVVVGTGIAGLTAGLVLASDGHSVVCVDPVRPPWTRVGESLDWSAPFLLDRVGIPVETLVEAEIGTWKREVHGVSTTVLRMVGRPKRWMSRRPLKLRLATVHDDRPLFDSVLYERALESGVRFVWDRVTGVDIEGDRVVCCRTGSGVAAR